MFELRCFLSLLYILLNAKIFCVCVCIIKLLCHFLPDLAQILNKAMNSKGAASKPVPGADFTQLLILRHLFVSHTQILADSQSDCEKVVEPKRNPNRTDFFGIQLWHFCAVIMFTVIKPDSGVPSHSPTSTLYAH